MTEKETTLCYNVAQAVVLQFYILCEINCYICHGSSSCFIICNARSSALCGLRLTRDAPACVVRLRGGSDCRALADGSIVVILTQTTGPLKTLVMLCNLC